MRGGELGGIPESAVLPVKDPEEGVVGLIEDRCGELALAGRGAGCVLQRFQHLAAGVLEFLPLALPDLVDPGDEVKKAGHPVAALLRDVTRCKEGFFVRCHEDGERPPSGPGQRVGGRHVNLVDIRPLFSVHLDADEDVV